jgi:hypothetical protein
MGVTTTARMLVIYVVLSGLVMVNASISIQALVLAIAAELYLAYSVFTVPNRHN